MKKIAFSVILSAICLTFACSCGVSDTEKTPPDNADTNEEISQPENAAQGNSADKTENNSQVPPTTDYFAALPDEDYGGREFVIAATDTFFADADTSTGLIGEHLRERTAAIEKKLNIDIRVVPVETQAVSGRLSMSDKENTFCDLLYMPMDTISRCAEDGLVAGLYSLPFFNEDSEYVNAGITDTFVMDENVYGIYGNAAFDDRFSWCVYYNNYLMAGLGYDIPALVASGQWTWEKFLEIASAAVFDIDQNGRMNRNTDRYGYASTAHTNGFDRAVFASSGKKFLSLDDEGFPKMDFASTEQDDYFSEISEICTQSSALYPVRIPGDAAANAFAEGRLAFFCEKLTYAQKFAYIPMNWSIAPMPKRNAAQSGYISHVDKTVCGYAVPVNVSDSALAGKVLDAIYAYDYSYGENIVCNAWTYYYLRDNISAAAVKNICRENMYDAAYVFDADERIPDSTYRLLGGVLAGGMTFSRRYEAAEKVFGEYVREKFAD